MLSLDGVNLYELNPGIRASREGETESLSQYGAKIFDLCLDLCDAGSTGSWRSRSAAALVDRGDYSEALKVLSEASTEVVAAIESPAFEGRKRTIREGIEDMRLGIDLALATDPERQATLIQEPFALIADCAYEGGFASDILGDYCYFLLSEGKIEESRRMAGRLLETREAHGAPKADIADAHSHFLASYSGLSGDSEALETHARAARALYGELAAADHLSGYRANEALSAFALGTLLKNAGRLGEAEPALREALDLRRQLAEGDSDVYGEDLADAAYLLGEVLLDTDRADETVGLWREAIDVKTGIASRDSSYKHLLETAFMAKQMAESLYLGGRWRDSEQFYRVMADAYRKQANMSTGLPGTVARENLAVAQYRLGIILDSRDRERESENFLRKSVALYRELAAEDPESYRPAFANAELRYGMVLNTLHRFGMAVPNFEEAYAIYKELAQEDPDKYRFEEARSAANLVTSYKSVKKLEEVSALLPEAIEKNERLMNEEDEATYGANFALNLSALADALGFLGRYEEAEEMAETAYGFARRSFKRDAATAEVYRLVADIYAGILQERGQRLKGQRIFSQAMDDINGYHGL